MQLAKDFTMGYGRSCCLNPKPIFFPLCHRVLTFKPIEKPHHNIPGMEESGHRNWGQGSSREG